MIPAPTTGFSYSNQIYSTVAKLLTSINGIILNGYVTFSTTTSQFKKCLTLNFIMLISFVTRQILC